MTPLQDRLGVSDVFAEGPARTRIVWIADLLPHQMAPAIEGMIEQGMIAMKQSLERTGLGGPSAQIGPRGAE